jgi:hypothetical protein
MIVQDKFLPEEDFNIIKNYILGNQPESPHWYYGEKMSYVDDSKDLFPLDTEGRIQDSWSFRRDIFSTITGYGDKNAMAYMVPIMKRILEINGPETQFKCMRFHMKCFSHFFKETNYNSPHIDHEFPHKSMILYLNDSDGDTYYFDQYYDGTPIQDIKFTVKERVSPRANRAIIFDGYQYHAGSNPLYHDTRVLINITYV